MKSLLQSMVLTVVILALNSVAWADIDVDKDKPAATAATTAKNECEKELPQLKAKQTDIDAQIQDASDKKDLIDPKNAAAVLLAQKELRRLRAEKLKIDTRVNECKDDKTTLKDECKTYREQANAITKDYPYDKQVKAMKCLAEDREEKGDGGNGVAKAVLSTLGGTAYSPDVTQTCRVNSKDKDYREQFEKAEKRKDEKRKEIFEVDKDMISDQKDYAKQLKQLEDQRQDLKEDWEKKQTDQEAQQQRALNAMKENQLKIQEQVRKSNAELIVARQEAAKAERKRDDELAKSGLQSSQSIIRICEAQAREYIKKMGYDKKRTKTSGSGAIGSGKKKKDDVNSVLDDCIKQAETRRSGVYEDFQNYQVQMAANIQIREQQLSDLEGQFKSQYEDYTKAMEREQSTMTKAYANYIQKDQQIAKSVNELMQSQQQERYSKTMKKQQANQEFYAAGASMGEIGDSESEALLEKNEEYVGILEKMRSCPDLSNTEKERITAFQKLRGEARQKVNDRGEASK